jgi:hypothetical protein
MCHWSPTKFRCLSWSKPWSDEVTKAFPVKLVLCNHPSRCDIKSIPTREDSVVCYAADMCDYCYPELLNAAMRSVGKQDATPEFRASLLDDYRKERRQTAPLWAMNMSGQPEVYINPEESLTAKQNTKRVLKTQDERV